MNISWCPFLKSLLILSAHNRLSAVFIIIMFWQFDLYYNTDRERRNFLTTFFLALEYVILEYEMLILTDIYQLHGYSLWNVHS